MGDIQDKLRLADQKLKTLSEQMTELQRQLAVEEERAKLLRRLLDLERPTVAQIDRNGKENRRASGVFEPKTTSSSLARLEDAVVSILGETTGSIHIGEIRAKLIERGIRIPGKGNDANIIARLIREPRIERESGRRGYYRLRH